MCGVVATDCGRGSFGNLQPSEITGRMLVIDILAHASGWCMSAAFFRKSVLRAGPGGVVECNSAHDGASRALAGGPGPQETMGKCNFETSPRGIKRAFNGGH